MKYLAFEYINYLVDGEAVGGIPWSHYLKHWVSELHDGFRLNVVDNLTISTPGMIWDCFTGQSRCMWAKPSGGAFCVS